MNTARGWGVSVRKDLFERAWDFQPALARPRPPMLPAQYSNEKAAERALEALLSPYFRPGKELFRQVRLTETGYPPQFIDYVLTMPEGSSIPAIGIECKSGFPEVKDMCAAIRQAMRYRKASISDQRLSHLIGNRLSYVALWPPLMTEKSTSWCSTRPNPELVRATYLAERYGESRALALFAQHFNVGHIEFSPWWSAENHEWEYGFVFMNGQQQVWTSRYFDTVLKGFRGGEKLAADKRRGLRYLD